jgi:hypothetical protein
MRSARFYSNETLCRMEAIFERSCLDLGIEGDSAYARSARETLALLLFELPPPEEGCLIQRAAEKVQCIARRNMRGDAPEQGSSGDLSA